MSVPSNATRTYFNYGRARMDHKSRVLVPKRVMEDLKLTAPCTLYIRTDEDGNIVLTPIGE